MVYNGLTDYGERQLVRRRGSQLDGVAEATR